MNMVGKIGGTRKIPRAKQRDDGSLIRQKRARGSYDESHLHRRQRSFVHFLTFQGCYFTPS